MWRAISEEEKAEMARISAKKNPAFSFEGYVLYILAFFIGILISVETVIPGKGSSLPYPEWSTILERIAVAIPYCFGICFLVFLTMILSYKFEKKEKRLAREYKRMFSTNKRICVKCNEIVDIKIMICPKCNKETENINNYIWVD